MNRMRKIQRGISMIEVAVMATTTAIVYSIAAPGFGAWITNVQIRTAAEGIQNGLQLARAEAIRRNRSVMFWLTAAGTGGTDWMVACASPPGTAAIPEAPGDCPGPASTLQPPAYAMGPSGNWIQWQTQQGQQTTQVQITNLVPGNADMVTFNSMGLVVNNINHTATPLTEIDLSVPTAANPRTLHITINSGGSVRLCDPLLAISADPRGCN